MEKTEKKIIEIAKQEAGAEFIVNFRSEKDSKKLKDDMKDLYKDLIKPMVSY